MNLKQIKRKIEKAIKDENQTRRLESSIRAMARDNNSNPTEEQIQGVVDFVKEYAQQVPFLLEQGIAEARQLGLSHEMNQMVSELKSYWMMEDDLIPDHRGLVGIMDDAYASMLLLQSLSDYCKVTIGRPFLANDLTSANQFIRQLIGEPAASALDQRVGVTLSQAMMNQLVRQFIASGLTLGGVPDFSWGAAPGNPYGGYSLDEYVDIQLGALGIV